jgi:tungstate transport system substrate-binding protein
MRRNSHLCISVTLAFLFATASACLAEEGSIVLASTPSIVASGLLEKIIPIFTAKTGIAVDVIAKSSRASLDSARVGEADLLLVHNPDAEKAFIDQGQGLNQKQVAWISYVIVGPWTDPAGVRGSSDFVAAFKGIALKKTPFVSRGDQSSANTAELALWKLAGLNSEMLHKGNWYRNIDGDMNQTLIAANLIGAYSLSDRATWLKYNNKNTRLTIIGDGDERLIKRFDVIELNPQKHKNDHLAMAKTLADWLTSPTGQQAIGSFQINGQSLFNPSATSPK